MTQSLTITIVFKEHHTPATEGHLKKILRGFLAPKGIELKDNLTVEVCGVPRHPRRSPRAYPKLRRKTHPTGNLLNLPRCLNSGVLWVQEGTKHDLSELNACIL